MIYWVLSTPRSGSNYFMSEIWRHLGGDAARAPEYLNPAFLRPFVRRTGFIAQADAPVKSFLDHLRKHLAFQDVLGIKLFYIHLIELTKYNDFMDCFFGAKVIYLYRENVIRQGISLYIAQRTGEWKAASCCPPAEHLPNVPYSFSEIGKSVAFLESYNVLLRRFLLVNEVSHVTVSYEEFLQDTEAMTARLVQYLGLESMVKQKVQKNGFKKQATQLNLEFYDRFIADERSRCFGDGNFKGPPLFD